MAFPSVRSSTLTNGTTASATPAVNLPATVAAGDTLLVIFRSGGANAGAVGWPDASWNELVDASPDGSIGQVAIAWKKAVGGEGGTTITLSSGNNKFAATAYAIQAAADPTVRPPEISTVAVGTTGEPDATTVTPTGGAKDYLWLTTYTMEGEQTGVTAYPTNYSVAQQWANSGTAGVVTTNCTIGSAVRTNNNAASEDAGVWDVAGTIDDSSSYTLAFHPASEVTAPLYREYENSFPRTMMHRGSVGIASLTIALNLLSSTLAPVEGRHNVRLQVTHRQQAAAVSTLTITSNLLQTTLAPPAVQVPFAQKDWPIPVRSAPRLSTLSGWTQDWKFVDQKPFNQFDWPIPVRSAAPVAGGWTQDRKFFYVDQKPFNQTDWPIPTRRRPGILVTMATRERGTVAAASLPFNQFDWPIPVRRRPDHRPLQQISYYVQSVLEQPAAQPILHVPPRLTTNQRLLTIANGRPIGAVDQYPPGPRWNWVVPSRSIALAGLLTITSGPVPTTPAVEARPIGQTVSSFPAPSSPAPPTWVDSRIPFTLNPIPPGQSVLGVPERPGRTSELYAIAEFRPPYFVDQFPVGRQNITIPQTPGRVAGLSTHVQVLTTSTLTTPPGTPIVPVLWPNPGTPGRSLELSTWLQGRKSYYTDQYPVGGISTSLPGPAKAPLPSAPGFTSARPFFYQEPGQAPPVGTSTFTIPVSAIRPVPSFAISANTILEIRPFESQEWAIPTSPRVASVSWTWTRPPFFREPDPVGPQLWAVPAPWRRTVGQTGWIVERKFYYQDQKPFHQDDWPNPSPWKRQHELSTWLREGGLYQQLGIPPLTRIEFSGDVLIPGIDFQFDRTRDPIRYSGEELIEGIAFEVDRLRPTDG